MLLMILIVANAALAIFSLITLPVEYDASNRALKWMEMKAIVTNGEHDMAKDALKWAALTYLIDAFYFAKTIAFCSASIIASEAYESDLRLAKSANFTFFLLLAIIVL